MIYNSDWMDNDIPDKSINLIIADPPYFEVKGEFDFIWPDFESYLQDVEKWAAECKRVLADNGCLFWWGHAKKIAYTQIIFDKYFKLENSLVWWVYDRQTNKGVELFRSFAPVTERCLFYSNEIIRTGLEEIKLDVNNFKTLRNYFEKLQKALIPTKKHILEEIGTVADHCFRWGSTQWELPTEETYKKLCEYPLKNDFIPTEYEELRAEYEELRRPFNNQYKLTDVIKHSQEAQITTQYDHETIKPLILTKKLIQTTTRENDLVLIPFGGSGTDVEACIDTGRNYICYEIAEKHFNIIKEREKQTLLQMDLFKDEPCN